VILGRGVSVDLGDVQAKLVRHRRGGYCYQHGLLFAAALDRLGFDVTRLLARVGGPGPRPRPKTHMTLAIGTGDERWLADVGFGSGLLEPLPLHAKHAVIQGDWEYRLIRPPAGTWQLQERRGQDWTTLYSVTQEPAHFSDVVMSNHYTSTWPDSPFRQQPVVVRKNEHDVRSLLGRRLMRTLPDGTVHERHLEDTDIGPTLRDLGLDLTSDETDHVIAAIPTPLHAH
jgi:N-hydroxyarylamine O-acetyltransferase